MAARRMIIGATSHGGRDGNSVPVRTTLPFDRHSTLDKCEKRFQDGAVLRDLNVEDVAVLKSLPCIGASLTRLQKAGCDRVEALLWRTIPFSSPSHFRI